MTSLTLRTRLLQLNVASSYSRPRVSDDIAFIEPLFRTLKHGAVEPVSENRFCHEYRVKSLPLLHASVQFQLSG